MTAAGFVALLLPLRIYMLVWAASRRLLSAERRRADRFVSLRPEWSGFWRERLATPDWRMR